MAYAEVQSMLDYGAVPGRRYYSRANFVPDVGDDLVGALGEQFLRVPSPLSFVLVFQFGGAATRVAPEATAFPHRDAAFMLELFPAWTEAGDDERNIGWVRQTWEALQPFLSPGNYVNALALGEGDERVRRSYGPITYERLVAIKNRYDPANLFRLNQNITPKV
jgi:FAD/FMN-containing dehydrogenase